ncbi:3108_t:CDS:2 [Cetraspora pellucida]|uniref:3108_t:CDS:1 n=1 Tax=Cetraspora pellucida TaxID=1433469 RepID=A0A9N9IIM9_9GLOM|nr:3108_t:CDS:2 [Cetraspora pellucida]
MALGLKYPEYWNRPYSSWGSLTAWEKFFKSQTRNSTQYKKSKESRCSPQGSREERPDSEPPRRAYLVIELLRLRAACMSVRTEKKRRLNCKGDDDNIYEVEELCVNICEFPALLGYCQSLEEMQENSRLFEIPMTPPTILRPALHINDLKVILREYSDLETNSILDALLESKQIEIVATRYQIRMRKWLEWLGLRRNNDDHFYNIDIYTALSAIMSVLLYNPAKCRGPGSHPSEAHVKIQMWSKILSDSFTLNQVRFEPIWKLNHLFPGSAREGSSRSDFAAVILDSKQWQFPFFIVKFERQGFEVHKDFAVVVCEAVFELNKILSRTHGLSPAEITQIRIHVGLINDTSINLGAIRPIFNDAKTAILYVYDQDIVSYNIQTGYRHNDVKNVLNLIVYLRQIVCSDGLVIKNFLERLPTLYNQSILKAIPKHPDRAEKSRKASTKINLG